MELPRFTPSSAGAELVNTSMRAAEGWQNIFMRAEALKQSKERHDWERTNFANNLAMHALDTRAKEAQLKKTNLDFEVQSEQRERHLTILDSQARQAKNQIATADATERLLADLPNDLTLLDRVDPRDLSALRRAKVMLQAKYGPVTNDPRFVQIAGSKLMNLQDLEMNATKVVDDEANDLLFDVLQAQASNTLAEKIPQFRQDPRFRRAFVNRTPASQELIALLAGAAKAEQENTSTFNTQMGVATAKATKEASDRHREQSVEGFEGVAPTKEEAIKFREATSVNLQVIDGVKNIVELAKDPTASVPKSPAYERIKTLQAFLVGRLRLPMTGPGAFTDSEREFVRNAIGNPANIFSLRSAELAKIDELINRLNSDIDTTATGLGLRRKQPKKVTAADLLQAGQRRQ